MGDLDFREQVTSATASSRTLNPKHLAKLPVSESDVDIWHSPKYATGLSEVTNTIVADFQPHPSASQIRRCLLQLLRRSCHHGPESLPWQACHAKLYLIQRREGQTCMSED